MIRNTSRYRNAFLVRLVGLGAYKSMMFASRDRNYVERIWTMLRAVKRTLRHAARDVEIVLCSVFMRIGDKAKALHWSETILARNNDSLDAQNLWLQCRSRAEGSESFETMNRDLSRRFCDRPFKWLEFGMEDKAYVCCPAWLPVSIGSAHDSKKAWHSPTAKKIRASILDGSYRYCSRVHCPFIAAKTLPFRKANDADPQHVVAPPPPKLVNLAYDRSCNIACPSCRVTVIVASKAEQAKMREFYNDSIGSLIDTSDIVNVTGSGDPFGSPHFRWVIRQITEANTAKIDIQTNGVLFDERAWNDLQLNGRLRRVLVSLDAAQKDTYNIVRRGGSFEKVLNNVRFLVEQRRQGQISFIGLDFVVQAINFRQIPEFIALGKSLGVDKVRFNMIRDWSTFTGSDFEKHFVGTPQHPHYKEFESIVLDPTFLDPIVDPGNLWQFTKQTAPKQVVFDRDVLHA